MHHLSHTVIQAADRVGKWFRGRGADSSGSDMVRLGMVCRSHVATQHTMALLTIACPCFSRVSSSLGHNHCARARSEEASLDPRWCLSRETSQAGHALARQDRNIDSRASAYSRMVGDDRWVPFIAAAETKVNHPMAAAILDSPMR